MAENVSVVIPAKDIKDKDQNDKAYTENGEENSSKDPERERKKLPPVDIAAAQTELGPRSSSASQTPRTPGTSRNDTFKDKEKKIGHRRVDHGGQVTYKKIGTSQIMSSIQLGIHQAVGSLARRPKLDIIVQDFYVVETLLFPSSGSQSTPAHQFSEFRFKVYAPIAFRHFRDIFHIAPEDYLMSLCNESLRELSNPGASGSIFYLTNDDEFIIKTVQHKEAEFLQKLLPAYYMNLHQNPRTLLPKFFGLYTYQCNAKNIRLIVMNNLLPTSIKMHQKYDLKGSTYKRKANKYERKKTSPTFKDLDFMEHHPDGILLEAETYRALVNTIERDCRVLSSFRIMDYSLLVGIHNLDLAAREKAEKMDKVNGNESVPLGESNNELGVGLNRSRSINRQRLVAHSTAMESIQANADPIDEEDQVPPGGIPARNTKGERLLLFLGIIDILQSYRLKKKLEHSVKAIIHDGDTISVHRPNFYSERFQKFMSDKVFKRIPSLDLPEITGQHRKFRTLVSSLLALRHSPSRRRGPSLRAVPRPLSQSEEGTTRELLNRQESQISQTDLKLSTNIQPLASTLSSKTDASSVALESTTATIDGASVSATSTSATKSEGGASATLGVEEGKPQGGISPAPPPLNLPAVLQDRPRCRHPPPVPPRSPRGGRMTQGGALPPVRGTGFVYSADSHSFRESTATSYHSSTGESATASSTSSHTVVTSSPSLHVRSSPSHVTTVSIQDDRTDVVRKGQKLRFKDLDDKDTSSQQGDPQSVSDVQLEPKPDQMRSSLGVETASHVIHGRGHHTWTPPLSIEGSTPTWTEGTPSFTGSSSSGDLGCPYTPVRSLNTTHESAENISGTDSEMVAGLGTLA